MSISACPRLDTYPACTDTWQFSTWPVTPGVLAGHPHGVVALLDVTGLVEHQHPVVGAEMGDHVAA